MVNSLRKMPVKAMGIFKKLVVGSKFPEVCFALLRIPFSPKTTVSLGTYGKGLRYFHSISKIPEGPSSVSELSRVI